MTKKPWGSQCAADELRDYFMVLVLCSFLHFFIDHPAKTELFAQLDQPSNLTGLGSRSPSARGHEEPRMRLDNGSGMDFNFILYPITKLHV